MRLLSWSRGNRISLTVDLADDERPPYAILSHTWAVNSAEEVSFADLQRQEGRQKSGYSKIQFCIDQARKDDFQHCWIDTCCIDKTNNNELSEAINSMFRWYQQAAKCYVYLSDVSTPHPQSSWTSSFRNSRWFTRGWTLQELLAPQQVVFFSREGQHLGTKHELKELLYEISGIPIAALDSQQLSSFSIDERMRWRRGRTTKKKEDEAYCLLGIFGVYMPLIYGEGDHAFVRLAEQIHKKPKIALSIRVAEGAEFDAYGQAHKGCHPATRVDLLQAVRTWACDEYGRTIFWLNGMAGTGKSTISWTVAKWLVDLGLGGPVSLGASFFFKRGEGDRASARSLFPTIAAQLAVRVRHFDVFLTQAIQANPQICNKALGEQFDKLICEPLRQLPSNINCSTYIIVLDALDECDSEIDVRTTLQLWSTLPVSKSTCLRLFVTSRPELVLRLGFKRMDTTKYQEMVLQEVPQPSIEHDIFAFLTDALAEVRTEYNLEPVGDVLASDWPGSTILHQLTRTAVPLFIIAATIYRFLRDADQPQERLEEMLQSGQSSHLDEIGGVYKTVLSTLAMTARDELLQAKVYRRFQIIVGTIVCLAEPLSRNTLAALLDVTVGDVQLCLRSLHALLHVPSDENAYIRPLHLSFSEYLTSSPVQHEKFAVNAAVTHRMIWQKCLRLLSTTNGLREDICHLKQSGQLRTELPPSLIDQHISPQMRYACRYWVYHTQFSDYVLSDGDEIHVFLRCHFLHWLEALSLLDRLVEAFELIDILLLRLAPENSCQSTAFLNDARRFLLANRFIISLAPLQLYSSALVFAPETSLVRRYCGPPAAWIQKSPRTPLTWGHELQKLEGHTQGVEAVAFSPDDSLLASGSNDNTTRLWNPSTGQEIQKIEGHEDTVTSLVFLHDQSKLASASDDGTIRLRDPRVGQEIRRLEGDTNSKAEIVLSHDSLSLTTYSFSHGFRIWDLDTGQERWSPSGDQRAIEAIAFSADDTVLLVAPFDDTVRLWNTTTGQEIQRLFGYPDDRRRVAFSHDGRRVAATSGNQTLHLWDLSSNTKLWQLNKDWVSLIQTIAFSPNTSSLAFGLLLGTIQLLNSKTGQELCRLDGHASDITKMVFSNSGSLLASASEDCTVRLWGLCIDQQVRETRGHSDRVGGLAFSHNGLTLASASYDTVRLWNPSTGRELQHLGSYDNVTTNIIFSHDDSLLASALGDGKIRIWTLPIVHEQVSVLEGHESYVRVVASSHNSLLLAASNDRTVRLWDVSTLEQVQRLEGQYSVETMTFSPDDSLLAAATDDRTVYIWDVSTGQMVREIESDVWRGSILSMALSHDTSLLAVTSSIWRLGYTELQIWSLSESTMVQTITCPDYINSTSFSANDECLLTNRGIVRLSSAASGYTDPETSTREGKFLENEWLTYNGEKLLWLPHGYREVVAVHGDTVAFGTASGVVTIMRVCHPSELSDAS